MSIKNSGEHQNGRNAVDKLTRRIVDQSRRDGRPVTHEQARERAIDSARRHDRRRDGER